MGHGKNKQKTQKGGLGQEPKETREQRRRRLADEAKAKEDCLKILPYVLGGIVFLILAFGIYVRTLPPKMPSVTIDPAAAAAGVGDGPPAGMTFEQALSQAEMEQEQDPEDVVNLDGDEM